MKYVFDHYAIQYMLEQFPRNIAENLWELFVESCSTEVIVSHREAQKLIEQEAVESTTLEWSKKNSSLFKPTTLTESKLLGELMKKQTFEFLETPRFVRRRLPEAIPFILCMAKVQNRCFVYRKNTNTDFISKIKSICDSNAIKHMELEECLLSLRNSNN